MINKPDPEYCNIRLALAHVLHACGAANMIAAMYGPNNDEAIINQSVYLHGPFVYDDVLFHGLNDHLLI